MLRQVGSRIIRARIPAKLSTRLHTQKKTISINSQPTTTTTSAKPTSNSHFESTSTPATTTIKTPTTQPPLNTPPPLTSNNTRNVAIITGLTSSLILTHQLNNPESALNSGAITTLTNNARSLNFTEFVTELTHQITIQNEDGKQFSFFDLSNIDKNSLISRFFPTVYANSRLDTIRSIIPHPAAAPMGMDYHVYGGLSPMEFRPFRCSDISVITEDTCLYCFNLATPSAKLNLPVTSYVLARSEIGGETVIRPYTPIANFMGELPVVVKTYPNAKMGGKFAEMEVGDTMYFKGPFQTFVYEPNSFDRVTLVAGGTGVTPMMQLIDKILTNPVDRTKMHLILANGNEYNMPLAAELNEFAETYPNRLRVTHVIEKPMTKEWDGLVGHISKELLLVSVGKPHPHHKIFVSGPQGFMKTICGQKGEDYTQGEIGGMLQELGFSERDVFKF